MAKRSGVAEGSSETVGEGEHAVVRGKVEKGAREGRWGREQAKWEEGEEGLETRGEREQIFTRPRRQRLDFYVVFDSSAFLGN